MVVRVVRLLVEPQLMYDTKLQSTIAASASPLLSVL